MNSNLGKYGLYALGEISLVIIGILIALQIDNWNTEKQQQATLHSYLQSIARNLRADAVRLESLYERRVDKVFASNRILSFLPHQESFGVQDVFYFSRALQLSIQPMYFNADTSGYDALKSSGVLDRMQGSEIERVLSSYYDNVRQVENLERDQNELIRSNEPRAIFEAMDGIENYAVINPSALSEIRFQELQPVYRSIINNPRTFQAFGTQFNSSQILVAYSKLLNLSAAYVRMADAGRMELDELDSQTLWNVAMLQDQSANPGLVTDGQLASRDYFFGVSDNESIPVFSLRSVELLDGALHVRYPGTAEWASFWISVLTLADDDGRPNRDYSRFSKLELEIKGDIGAETVLLHMKDKDDPDDGSQTNIELQLSNEWQTIQIDLDRFQTADLGSLHIPLGFLFDDDPVSFSIRSARFIEGD